MKWGALIGTAVGLGLAAWLIVSFGVGEILALLGQAGWGILAVVLFHVVQILFSALAWRAVAGPTAPQPSLRDFMVLRWIREGVNNLLPVAQIGGEVVAARLLRKRGTPLAWAVAGSVGDLTMEMLTQIVFTLLGLALLILLVGESGVSGYVLGGLGVAALGAVAFIAAQWFGLAGLIERGILKLSNSFGWAPLGEIGGLDAAIRGIYRRPGRVALAGWHHSVSWLLGGVEVCLALHLLGTDVGLGEGIVIEALGQALKAAGFAVPGALGVAEGGYVVVCHLFGLSPELAIALGLVKRVREIGLGVPALLAWQWLERRPALPPATTPGTTTETSA
ncbi:MAG: lysylphosphatidylglycerol synthase domain-containing protein [Janthinobacterium lividum]